MRGFRLVALAIIQLAGSGCGYKLIDYSEPIAGLGSVAIQTFKNESYEPGVEFVVADALRREFLRRGALILVCNRGASRDMRAVYRTHSE